MNDRLAWPGKLALRVVGALWGALITLPPEAARAQEPYYKDKQIRLVVGSAPGGGYDTYARLVSTHWRKHIPGNPTIIVQNMPGASAMIAANYVYKVAKPDGLTLGGIRAGLYFDQLVARKEGL